MREGMEKANRWSPQAGKKSDIATYLYLIGSNNEVEVT